MRSTLVFMLIGIACVLGLVLVQEGSAAIFKYVDNDGLINFADDLQTIPVQFRSSAKIVGGEPEKEKSSQPQSRPQDQSPTGSSSIETPAPMAAATSVTAERNPFSRRILISLIVVVSALFAFSILGILSSDYEKAVKIVRLVILWGVSVFLLYAHTMDVVHLFDRVGKSASEAQREREEKGKKTAQKIREFNAFVEQVGNEGSTGQPDADQEQKP